MPDIVLLNPPVTKPGEPPAGIARLCGALRAHGVDCAAADLNIECLLSILEKPLALGKVDNWTRRAEKNSRKNIDLVRSARALENFDSYKKAVLELDRLASRSYGVPGVRLGLTDYSDLTLSPLKSGDLLRAAETFESSPFFPFFSKRISAMLAGSPSCCVGISINYLSQALPAFAIAGYIRREFPQVRIILGGGLITSWLSRAGWRDPFNGLARHLVSGPGEQFLLSLFGKENHAESWQPDYFFYPIGNYLSPGPVVPYSTAGGCWWKKCSFCPEKAEGSPYSPLASDRALSEIKELVEMERPALIHFLDNALSPAFLQRAIERPPGVPWYGFARITRQLTDRDFCRALRRSGCVMLKLGIESGDQRVLDKLNKGIDLRSVEASLKSLREAGIATYVYLLFGTPPENLEAARNTRDFVLKNGDAIGFLNLAIFNLPAYSDFGSEDGTGLKRKTFYDGDLSLYSDFEHPSGWGRKNVRQFLDKEFRRLPAIAAILRRDPPLFTSNHAPFFTSGFSFPESPG